jgi:hypothetical protein
VIEPCALLSRRPSHPPERSASAIRRGRNSEGAIRYSPFDPRWPFPRCQHLTERRAAFGSIAASKCDAADRAARASSSRKFLWKRFGRGLSWKLSLPIRQASRLAAAGDCHQPNGHGIVLRGSLWLISPEKSHQRCSVQKATATP